jgi:predicted phosphodiesterase
MKIQLASDLHLEFLARQFPGETLIRPAYQADALVLAGDVGHAADAIALFADFPVPVLYVMGNHEAYGGCLESVIDELTVASCGTSVRFLEREAVDFGGVRFLGCTLWTDYQLQYGLSKSQLMENAQRRLNDHRLIHTLNGELFSPAHALRDHEASKAWLASELERSYNGKTVVITHHAPHPLSVHARYVGDPLNAAFASKLPELLQLADVWLHGHVHDSFDYSVEGCRVIANPRGYARNAGAARDVGELRFENNAFEPELVIDLSTI